ARRKSKVEGRRVLFRICDKVFSMTLNLSTVDPSTLLSNFRSKRMQHPCERRDFCEKLFCSFFREICEITTHDQQIFCFHNRAFGDVQESGVLLITPTL